MTEKKTTRGDYMGIRFYIIQTISTSTFKVILLLTTVRQGELLTRGAGVDFDTPPPPPRLKLRPNFYHDYLNLHSLK